MQRPLALFFARVLLGLILLMQGYGKIFGWGVSRIEASMHKDFGELLPGFVLTFTAYFTSYAELVAGLLLCLGLGRKYCYPVVVAVLLIVSFGHGLEKPVWELHHVMYRSMLVFTLMICPAAWDLWHLDHWLARHPSSQNPSST